MVALALAVRHRTSGDQGELQALQGIEQRIAREVERLEDIPGASEKIRKQLEIIERAATPRSSAHFSS
jgi:hypothetical protein